MEGVTQLTKQRTVLALDDDAGILNTITHALRSEGYKVRQARSRAAFEDLVSVSDIDIFLIDVMLPDGSGLEIARDLRSRTKAGIIIVTGRDEEMDRVIGLELGADDYVTKPFHIRELRARVNAVYRRTAPLREASAASDANRELREGREVLTFNDWTMDVPARRVTSPQGEVDLTTLEFDVLRALAAHPNRVRTRDQIMDEVRGPDWASYDRIVDGVISRLRQKLFPDGAGRRWIKTIRGYGYMMSRDG